MLIQNFCCENTSFYMQDRSGTSKRQISFASIQLPIMERLGCLFSRERVYLPSSFVCVCCQQILTVLLIKLDGERGNGIWMQYQYFCPVLCQGSWSLISERLKCPARHSMPSIPAVERIQHLERLDPSLLTLETLDSRDVDKQKSFC